MLPDNTPSPNYNYLDDLNEQQREAVTYNSGPALVIAGAGSGKTRVLTYKIVHLLRSGYEPWRILALTFTNKAANEMKERVAKAVGEQVASKIWMGTFHSVFLRLLRRHADLLGYKSAFTIYDASDSKALVRSIISEMNLDDKMYRPGTIAAIISNAKNSMVDAAAYCRDAGCAKADSDAGRPLTGEIFRIYEKRCRLAHAMDFDDILLNMNRLLRDFPEVAEEYQNHFRYILVDEYQDTNLAQHVAISQMAERHKNICVVGDDAQSIYSFRGANIDNILSLKEFYRDLKVFKLERNYRSTRNIIDAAGSLIEKNKRQLHKAVYSLKEEGEKISVTGYDRDVTEAKMVASDIQNTRLVSHDKLDDYAILYRTNSQSRALEEELRRLSIGYQIHSGLSFYQRKEIKDAVAYFRLAINPDDDQALLRVINFPARGIGKTTLKKLQAAATENEVSLWKVVSQTDAYNLDINKGTLAKLRGFADMIESFVSEAANPANDAYTVSQTIINRTSLIAHLGNDKAPEAISIRENLNELLVAAKLFVEQRAEENEDFSMLAFLSEISLASDSENEVDSEAGKVTLMTVHAAKGLEFKHIYIVGLEEELFPSSLSIGSEDEIEEERRLLYVAITRAMETCKLSYANRRFRNGQFLNTRPSRFINDIDAKYLIFRGETGDSTPFNSRDSWRRNYTGRPFGYSSSKSSYPKKKERNEPKLPPRAPVFTPPPVLPKGEKVEGTIHTIAELKEGMRIAHGVFGKGTITHIERENPNATIHVNFDISGMRKLLLKFAKFDIINE